MSDSKVTLGVHPRYALRILERTCRRRTRRKDTSVAVAPDDFQFAIARGPYADGNKRIGFIALVTFLAVNGVELKATDDEVVAMMDALAGGRATEDDLATWIRERT